MTETKKHATYSASGSERWLQCPASIKMASLVPPLPDNEYAREGTEAHEVLEYLLKNRSKPEAARRFLLANHAAHFVQNAEYALQAIDELIEQREIGEYELLVETKADYSFLEPDQFGTLDVAVVELFGKLLIIDYKYGAGLIVEPERNTQLLLYALAIAHAYDYCFETVELVIIQPRANHEAGSTRTWSLSIEDLKGWRDIFEKGIKRTKEEKPKYFSGSWCRWCPAAAICPEISKKKLEEVNADFDEITDKINLPVQQTLTPIQLARILDNAEAIETWISAAKTYAFNELSKGNRVPGWKLVEKRATRKWRDIDASVKEIRKLLGYEGFTKPEPLSPAQIEKLGGSKLKNFIAKYAVAVSSGLTLAREDDKRNPVNRAQLDFDDETLETEETKTEKTERKKSNGKAKKTSSRPNSHRTKKG